ncbi:Sec-independent protein translocase protein TatB [Acinetobacter baumannii]|uniref:Sec-independent protein translocase protein TatB n=1 Tax=Acinetobacter baumannii TaxID=470 RepID=UPI001900C779|nr:Sec-independent protein translocase protein TatB [Acinetobacter baumannii]MBJ9418441.1 twin-arginine translocase subunit TatB [Acinetobacter baumannii]MDV7469882.1 Sec-independent protein translocase protein TatB [Acinetobacter baumannii]MDV7599408.1 Sec-independent protein translocase protein TatB [Acinetobacter baumannii]MDV7666556.1 Sec-independent protein translocase protein TatB [Acinetobacter baumannii]
MFNVGFSELLVFGIIALLVLGPERLPEAARFAGKWYARLIRFINNAQQDINRELGINELREQMRKEMERITELEQKMQEKITELDQQAQNIDFDKLKTNDQELRKKTNIIYTYLADRKKFEYVFSPLFLEKRLTSLITNGQKIPALKDLKVAV